MNRRPNRPTSRPRPKSVPRKFAKGPARPGHSPQGGPVSGPQRGSAPAPGSVRRPPGLAPAPARHEGTHVVSLETLASSALSIARQVERVVLEEGKRADRALAQALRLRRDLAPPDHQFISQVAFALFRWRGWIEPLRFH